MHTPTSYRGTINPADILSLVSENAQLRAELAALQAGQGEAVAWIKPDVVSTLRADECCYAFGQQDKKKNLIPLYTAPPATGVIVSPELTNALAFVDHVLKCLLTNGEYAPVSIEFADTTAKELRALLAQSQETNHEQI